MSRNPLKRSGEAKNDAVEEKTSLHRKVFYRANRSKSYKERHYNKPIRIERSILLDEIKESRQRTSPRLYSAAVDLAREYGCEVRAVP